MASRILNPSLRTLRQPLTTSLIFNSVPRRTLTSTLPRLADQPVATAAPIAVKKPVGAFRAGVFGFLLGSTLAGAGTWFYIMEEYRVSNELLTEDIYALQAAVQRIHSLVTNLEERLALAELKQGRK